MSKKEIRYKLDVLLESCFILDAYNLSYGALQFAIALGAITYEEWLYLRRACLTAECSL